MAIFSSSSSSSFFFFFGIFSPSHHDQHNVTCLTEGGAVRTPCFPDAGDTLRYCVSVKASDAIDSAFGVFVEDDLRLIYQRSGFVFVPANNTGGTTHTVIPNITVDTTETSHRVLPNGFFTGPVRALNANDVCFLVADGGMSRPELPVSSTGTPVEGFNTTSDLVRRVNLISGAKVTMGLLGTENVEALAINATVSPFELFALDNDILGTLAFPGVNLVTSTQNDFLTGENVRFTSVFRRIGQVGTILFPNRGNIANACDSCCPGSSCLPLPVQRPLTTNFTDATGDAADIDSLTLFPYAPYELWGAVRRGGNTHDILFKFDTALITSCRAMSGGCAGTGVSLLARGTFGPATATTNYDGVEIYSRLINDIEIDRGIGSLSLPGMRSIIEDIDDMAFTGNQPPVLFAIANQGSDPGALVTVFYYDGPFTLPRRYLSVCGSAPAPCDSPTKRRSGAPGTTLLKGAFGTPDFEGMSFSPDGRLHMATGKDGAPCLPFLANVTDIVAGLNPRASNDSEPGGNCGLGQFCPTGFGCVQPENVCVSLENTVCPIGQSGCPCRNVAVGNTGCGSATSETEGVADGRRARCQLLQDVNGILSENPGTERRCVSNLNCFATDNFLWQVDPQTGQLLPQAAFFSLDQVVANNNRGDYESIACNTENPALVNSPAEFSFCYNSRVTNAAPASSTLLGGGAVAQSRIQSLACNTYKCSETSATLRVCASAVTTLASPEPPQVVLTSSDDDCTSTVAGAFEMQIGEVFTLTVTPRLTEGTTYNARVGLRLPLGFDVSRLVVVGATSVLGCGMSVSRAAINPSSTPTSITTFGVVRQFHLVDLGNITNPWDKTCSGTSFNAVDAQDDVAVSITYRLTDVAANAEGTQVVFEPVLIYSALDPGGVNDPVRDPTQFVVRIRDFVLTNATFARTVTVREPVQAIAQVTSPAGQTTIREGQSVTLCADVPTTRMCAHDSEITLNVNTATTPCLSSITGSSVTVTNPSSNTVPQCAIVNGVGTAPPRMRCNGKLAVNQNVQFCYQARLECPPSPTPTPTPTPPTPVPFPSCVAYDSNRKEVVASVDTFPGERTYNVCTTTIITVEPRVRLGNFVWEDTNRNGAQDSGELGINGVTVQLVAGGTVIASTLTAGNGAYEFSSVTTPALTPNQNNLIVRIPVAANAGVIGTRFLTPADQPCAAGDACDSDGVLSGGNIDAGAATLGAGSFVETIDFGFQPALADSLIGDLVWLDTNGDGIFQTGEPAIPGVIVVLNDPSGNTRATALTNSAGLYSFSNKGAGAFINNQPGWTIDVFLATNNALNGLAPTLFNQSTNRAVDSNGDPNAFAGRSRATFTTPASGDDTSIDFGFTPLRIGDRVWFDNNANGVQDAGETGVAGVVVELFTASNLMTPIATSLTDSNGNYFFTSTNSPVQAGIDYQVAVRYAGAPASLNNRQLTLTDRGTDDGLDSDGIERADFLRAATATFTSPPQLGRSDLTRDFGFHPCFVLGDRVWSDLDRDGVQDSGEPSTEQGLIISVLPAVGGSSIFSVSVNGSTTGANFVVSSCPNGLTGVKLQVDTVYRLQIPSPVRGVLNPSPRDQGGNDALDSDAVNVGSTAEITTVPARYLTSLGNGVIGDNTLDFGLEPPASVRIGNFVWLDGDADGVQDGGASEPGISGVTLLLFAGRGLNTASLPATPLGSTTTDSNGFYFFDERSGVVASSDYTIVVRLGTLPTNNGILRPSRELQGGNINSDSNGVLNDAAALVFAEVTTGGVSSIDNSIDFGLHQQVRIGDFVWSETDGDGNQVTGATPLANVELELVRGDGTGAIERTSTNAAGIYRFERRDFPSLTALTQYRVRIRVPQGTTNDPLADLQPTAFKVAAATDTNDNDGQLDGPRARSETDLFTSPALGQEVLTKDFGFVPVVRIGDFVWLDGNSNGQQDEVVLTAGLVGVAVELRSQADFNTVLATVRTTTGGAYEFNSRDIAGLLPNTNYSITIPLLGANAATVLNTPNVLVPTQSNVGSDSLDSDGVFNQAQQRSELLSIVRTGAFGSNVNTFDFGFTLPMAIGDFLFIDGNENGVQDDAGNSGVPNVVVSLHLASNGNQIATVPSDANGRYLFTERLHTLLPNTEYEVRIVPTQSPLSNFRATLQNVGTNRALDSNANPTSNPLSTRSTTARGTQDLTLDFGFIPLISTVKLGNFVWIDANGNGLQDGGEAVVAGVTVTLRNSSGVVLTTTTNTQGIYEFSSGATAATATGVRPNSPYEILIDVSSGPLANHHATASAVGANRAIDSNGQHISRFLVSASATTGAIGSEDMSFDFGFVPVYSIGNFVWSDNNGNGVQDSGEPGIPGVTVTLDAAGRTVRTTLTNSGGNYVFSSAPAAGEPDTQQDFILPATVYTVAIRPGEVPSFVPSPADVGGNDQTDSDAVRTGSGVTERFSHSFTATGVTDLSRDFGFTPDYQIGDFVWLDRNGNGVQDAGENGIANVTVLLFASASNTTAVASTLTSADGRYFFASSALPAVIVPNAVLFVMVDTTQAQLASLLVTSADQGNNNAVDSDARRDTTNANRVAIRAQVNPNLSVSDLTFDFGFVTQISLGDFVWRDTNGDGLQAGESGVPNVVVQLLLANGRVPVATTLTNAQGQYLFSSGLLANTNYVVAISVTQPTLLDTLSPSPANAGTDRGADSNGVYNAPLKSIDATVTTGNLGTDILDIDFGLTARFRLGDLVWRETAPPNGLFAPTESGIGNVLVELRDRAGATLLATTLTNATGRYFFDSLDHNLTVFTDYRIVVPMRPIVSTNIGLNNLEATLANVGAGANEATDSDGELEPNLPANQKRAFTIAATQNFGSRELQFDFGFTGEATIGDFVWNDLNSNGRQDAGEPGLGGIRVSLVDPTDTSGAVIATTVTSTTNAGFYQFPIGGSLVANQTYRVFILQSDVPAFKPTQANAAGIADAEDSDAVLSSDTLRFQINFVAPPFGVSDVTLDFGLVNQLTLGDFVWLDSDGDGIQDAGEPGIENVLLELSTAANPTLVVASAATDATGLYAFESGLSQTTDYLIRIIANQQPLETYQATVANVGNNGNDLADSDATLVSGAYQVAVRSPLFGQKNLTVDFGFIPRIRLGLVLWQDQNNDGQRDASEARLGGLPVRLVQGSTTLATTTTNAQGEYEFNSFAHPLTVGGTFTIAVDVPPALQPGRPNVGSDLTDSDGVFSAGTNDIRTTVTIPALGYVNRTIDFGLVPRFTIGDFVWRDDGDGVQSNGEPGINGVVVSLFAVNATGAPTGSPIATVTTNAQGLYQFSSFVHNLQPQTDYVIQVSVPSGLQPTLPLVADTNEDSNGIPVPGQLALVRAPIRSPTFGEIVNTFDFGFVPTCNIAGVLFEDADGNGVRSASEPLLANVQVSLRELGASPGPVRTVTTNSDGQYVFNCFVDSIEPGKQYEVTVNSRTDLPTLKETTPNVPPDTTDSDGVFQPPTNRTVITVTSPPYGTDLNNNDFGFVKVITIGDLVWIDEEQAGVAGFGVQQATGNRPVPNVPVRLYAGAASTTPQFVTSTDASGVYRITSFDTNLVPGTVYVVAVPTNDAAITSRQLTPVPPTLGTNTQRDSNGAADATRSESRATITMGAFGSTDTSIDFGFVEPPPRGITIGNFVWLDQNNDGRQDSGEPGVAGVTVRLIDPAQSDRVVMTTTTDSAGLYRFNNQDPTLDAFAPNTNYVVRIAANSGPLAGTRVATPNNIPSDDENDSDGVLGGTNNVNVDAPVNSGADGTVNLRVDFGFVRLEVGNFVWEDANGNGAQDAGEQALPNVVVQLRSGATVLHTTATDARGEYYFSTMAPRLNTGLVENAAYTIVIALGQNALNGSYVPTRQDANGVADGLDSDASLDAASREARVAYTAGAFGSVDHTRDFGLIKLLEIGDRVFNDNNGNGVQDAGDTPRADAIVKLYDGAGTTEQASTATDSNGNYLFSFVKDSLQPARSYLVVIEGSQLNGLVPAPTAAGNDRTVDSDGTFDTAKGWIQAAVTTGAFGTRDLDTDFGIMPLVEIGDFVWRDTNGDGRQTAGEPGIEGEVVILQRASDNVEVARTNTDSAGRYSFSNRRSPLRPDTAYVVLLSRNPPGLQLTVANAPGSTTGDDSNAVYAGSSPRATVTTGPGGSSDLTIDLGFVGQIRIGNVVFRDTNGDGVRQATEGGINGVVVTLYRKEPNGSLTLISQQPTTANGNYLFNSLDVPAIVPNADYVVSVASTDSRIANNALSPRDQGTDDTADSDAADGTTGFEIPVRTSTFGVDRLNNDFGFVLPLRIGDFVWVDTDADGLQDSNESGVPNVVLQLFRQGQSAPIGTTLTDAAGRYFFSSSVLPALVQRQTYEVVADMTQDALVPYRLTEANAALNSQDGADSDFALSSVLPQARALVTTPLYGQDDLTIDLGVKPSQVIGDRVWDDQNGNGVQDNGEPGLLGVELTLVCVGVVRETTSSAADGIYRFSRTVEPNTDCVVRVPLGQSALSGLEPAQSTVGGNRDVDSNGVVDSTRQNVNGLVRTGGLGSSDLTVDFGFTRGLSLGDFTWEDTNADGTQDSSEPALPGVTLDLYARGADFTNPNVAPIASTTSGADGRYTFASAVGVRPNTPYTIVIALAKNSNVRTNYVPTLSAGVDGQPADSDGVLNQARTFISAQATSGAPGVSKTIYDFGFVPVTCIGDRVWSDENGDGLQDAVDVGLGSVPVSLFATTGAGSRTPVCETTTDSLGRYQFCSSTCPQLVPSTRPYEVVTRISNTPGRRCTFSNVQGDTRDTQDSDAVRRGDECVATVTVPRAGFKTVDTDIGLVRELLIGDRLFIDRDSNGLDGNGALLETEPPVRGATVQLTRNGLVVETTVTDNNGKFLFGNGEQPLLQNTDYRVLIDMKQMALTELFPTKLSPPNQGFDSIDSNGVLNVPLDQTEAAVRTRTYGTTDRTIDFGFREETELIVGRNIWIDEDFDGFRDPNERPVSGVSVALYSRNGTFLASTVTAANGQYEFRSKRDEFRPFADYSIVVFLSQEPLIGFAPTFANEGKDDCIDSDGLTQNFGGFAALVANITTGDFGTTSVCNDFGLFDCIATDPGIGSGVARRPGKDYRGNEGVVFRGEASVDFPASKSYYVRVDDTFAGAPAGATVFGDVGIPPQYPRGSISGWDMRALYAAYSPIQNRMYFGIDCFGICGDADGDGDPGRIFPGLGTTFTAQDLPNLGGSETFSVVVDLNQDGTHDIIMGISSIVSGNFQNIPNALVGCPGPDCTWQVYTYVADKNEDFGNRYGVSLKDRFPATLAFNPSAQQPDLEWTVSNWSKMQGLFPNPFNWQVLFEVFAGSFVDGGIGEDRMPNEAKPGALRFLCWEIKPEDLVWPNNITLPIGDNQLTGACAVDNCCNYGHGAGCSDPIKEACVCRQDDYCCKSVWDKTCVARMANGCGGCAGITPGPTGPKPGVAAAANCTNGGGGGGGTGANDCCVVHNYGGCQSAAVTACVAALDPFCGAGRWDAGCIEKIKTCPGALATTCGAISGPTPAPAPTPAPGTACEKGRLACDCRADGSCLAGEGTCDAAKNKCLRQQCAAGTPGCSCGVNNACSGSTSCNIAINTCVSAVCVDGDLACRCRTSGAACNAGAVCKTGFCSIDSCRAGDKGCSCAPGNACSDASTQCVDSVCVTPPPPCPVGTNSCPCRAGTIDRCNGALVCQTNVCVSVDAPPTPAPTPAPTPVPDNGVSTPAPSMQGCDARKDADGDGVPDCKDEQTKLTDNKKPGDVKIDVHDPAAGDKKVGTVTIVSKDGKPVTKVEGKDKDGNDVSTETVTTKPGRGKAPDGKGGEVDVPFIDIDAGAVKKLGGQTPFFVVCLDGKLPGGVPLGECCLGSRDSANDQWECTTQHLLVARGPVFCGYTPHLTQFAIIPKPNRLSSNDPIAALDVEDDGTGSGGLAGWAIALIVIGAVCYCVLCIVIVALLVRRRSRSSKPTRETVRLRKDDDIPLDVRSSARDGGAIQNPAFGAPSRRANDEAIVESLSDSSLSSLSEAGDRRGAATMAREGARNPMMKSAMYDVDADQGDEKQATSILDMATYQTLKGGNNAPASSNSAIDAAIFDALESESSSLSSD
jgi:hypothetical protein